MRFIILVLAACLLSCHRGADLSTIAPGYIADIRIDSLGGNLPEILVTPSDSGFTRIELRFSFADSVRQDDWHVTLQPAFDATFHWQPHLTPTDHHIVAQHVFRAPAIIESNSEKQIVVMPDLSLIGNSEVKWYMDLDARTDAITIGISKSKVTSHVLFEKDKGQVIPPGELRFAFYIMTADDQESIGNPWRKPLAFMWKKYGEVLYRQGQPIAHDLDPYIRHTYNWAFNRWRDAVWQEFAINGKKVGAPVFIVNVTQSPNYPGLVNEREFRSVWNQAWFSSLRSAQGLYRYGRRTNNEDYIAKANLTKELALAFPQKDGLFPSVVGTEMEMKEIDGKKYKRSKGWNTMFFGNSDRNPMKSAVSARDAPFHILDMSWTAYLMLTWNEELEKDARLVNYARRYADKLITMQDSIGFFPGWLDKETLQPLPIMNETPETSLSVTFLLKMHEVTNDARYLATARKGLDAVTRHIVPIGRWEDFETYWSCSRVLDTLVGKKVERNNAFKQNTLSMYWTAEALLDFYRLTGEPGYLKQGQRVLDELLMFQQTWQPPYIPIPVLGGFGVMNGDGEWNDSRQCLFAELIVQYGKALHNDEYVHRGIAALKSSFVMMYCPENPETRGQWEKVYPFFNEKDYGFMMENYGHGGVNNAEGLGIGEFTIYDWGNGAAAESYNKMLDHFGGRLPE